MAALSLRSRGSSSTARGEAHCGWLLLRDACCVLRCGWGLVQASLLVLLWKGATQ